MIEAYWKTKSLNFKFENKLANIVNRLINLEWKNKKVHYDKGQQPYT